MEKKCKNGPEKAEDVPALFKNHMSTFVRFGKKDTHFNFNFLKDYKINDVIFISTTVKFTYRHISLKK